MMAMLFPALSVILLTIVAVLPWGAVGAAAGGAVGFAEFGVALLPMMAVHYWSVRRPHLLPISLIFVCGLMIDVLSHGPLGFWAFLSLVAAAMAPIEGRFGAPSSAVLRFALFAVAMVVLALLGWGLSSAYFQRLIDWRPMMLSALGAVVVYPMLAMAFMPIDRLWDSPRGRFFVRGA